MIIENKEIGVRFEVKGKEDFEKWLAEHDKQIRAEVIDEVLPLIEDIKWLCRYDVFIDLKTKVEELKEQNVQNSIIEALKPKCSVDMPKEIICNCTKEQK